LSGYFHLPVQIEEFVGQWIELPTNCRCLMGLSASTLGVNTTVGSHVWDCQQKFRVILGPLDLDYYYRLLPGGSDLSTDLGIEGGPERPRFDDLVAAGASLGANGAGALGDAIGTQAGIDSNCAGRSIEGQAAADAASWPGDRHNLQGNGAHGGSDGAQSPSAPRGAISRHMEKQAARLGISLDRLTAAVRSYAGDELEWDLKLILKQEDAPPLGLGMVGHLGWSTWLMQDPLTKDPEDLVLAAMQSHDGADPIEFRYVRDWNQQTLGQTRDGRFLIATSRPEDSDVAQVTVST
jgi:hypothetical protein